MQRFEHLTVANTVKVLTAAEYHPLTELKARRALITIETASFRFKTDGNNPSAAEGHLVTAGGVVELDSSDEIKKFRAIRDTATSADISVTYFF